MVDAVSEVGEEMKRLRVEVAEARSQDVRQLDSFLQRLEQHVVTKLNSSLFTITSNISSLVRLFKESHAKTFRSPCSAT